MRISDHFDSNEFERDGDLVPVECLPNLYAFVLEVLEPFRMAFGEAWHITSGYRSPQVNKRIGGAVSSQHIYTPEQCAADGYFASYRKDGGPVFKWLRENYLPWDQCIWEHGKYGDVIHLSYTATPRRVALEGGTFNQTGYKSWVVSA